jgi:N-acetylneuraminic acid mutarotase
LTADDAGVLKLTDITPGVWAIRCLATDETPGTHEGVPYVAVKHYTTISFLVPDLSGAVAQDASATSLADLPQPITSFGATIVGGKVYAYGGHTGGAHSYANEDQFHQLVRLDPRGDRTWETLTEGPRVQGNALVGYKNNVLLVGGFSAENAKGEKSRLVSQSETLLWDGASQRWVELPNLPEPRSSMDATVLGNTLFVVGGWNMNGNSSETVWHKTAWKLPLEDASRQWQAIAAPPFERRAMAVIAHEGRVFVIGGMDSDGSPTTACNVYDPANDSWSEMDSLAGVPMNGFGAAAVVVGNDLWVSCVDGSLQRWNEERGVWEIRGRLETGRFFHRAVPLDDRHFVVLGGANMQVGKFRECTVVEVCP